MLTLLTYAPCKSHNGQQIDYTINCEDLSDDDICCIAKLTAKKLMFKKVIPTSNGCKRLSNELEKYSDKSKNIILIVDDVLTTSKTITRKRNELKEKYPDVDVIGLVIFCRSQYCPPWCYTMFNCGIIGWNPI